MSLGCPPLLAEAVAEEQRLLEKGNNVVKNFVEDYCLRKRVESINCEIYFPKERDY